MKKLFIVDDVKKYRKDHGVTLWEAKLALIENTKEKETVPKVDLTEKLIAHLKNIIEEYQSDDNGRTLRWAIEDAEEFIENNRL